MKRFFRTALLVLAMLAVMFVSAALTLRIALHGREVPIPDFAGKTVAEASEAALHSGLDLVLENKFYSTTIPAGRILSQAPAPGSRVRHGWQVRVTESLGPQQVTIPDTNGQPIRKATMDLRRAQLDLGQISHLDAPGDPDMVLAQTPPPNAGVDQPRVNLLLSATASGESTAFVMPSFVGMSYTNANRSAIALGLRVAALGEFAPVQIAPSASSVTTPNAGSGAASQTTAPAKPVAPTVQMVPVGPVTAQSPESGHRTARGATVRLTFGHTSANKDSTSTSPATAPPSPASTPPAPNPQSTPQ